MKLEHLALDIETVPARPLESYSASTQAALASRVARAAESDPTMTYEKFASFNADLGRIVCLSVGFVHTDNAIRLKSFFGEDERAILTEFNRIIPDVSGIFLHYNGIQFDIPFILRRMVHHGMRPSNPRFSNLRRYQSEPHLDIMQGYFNWDPRYFLSLGILAETHGLPTPKGDMSGDKVYAAFLAGEWDRIRRYCELDVATVLNLWRKAFLFMEPASCELYEAPAGADEPPAGAPAGLDSPVRATAVHVPGSSEAAARLAENADLTVEDDRAVAVQAGEIPGTVVSAIPPAVAGAPTEESGSE